MSKYPKRNSKRTDRWSGVDKVVDDAMEELDSEHKEVEAFYRVCRHWFPDRWENLEAFTEWNQQRLERIEAYDSAIDTYYDQSTADSEEEYKARKRFDYTGDPQDIIKPPVEAYNTAVKGYRKLTEDVTWPEDHDWRNGSP